MTFRIIEYANEVDLADAIVQQIVHDLETALTQDGKASLIVPGGTTPVAVFERLAITSIAWEKITVIPCDERWINTTHKDSNEGLIRRHLLKEKAAKAQFVGFYRPTSSPADAIMLVRHSLNTIKRPFSSVFLGMGADGHFASLFPGRKETLTALLPNATEDIMVLSEPANGYPRMGLTLSCLTDCRHILLALSGKEKHGTLNNAIDDTTKNTYPIAALLQQKRTPIEIFIGA